MPFQFRKEAIEEDLNSNFPSQGQGNPPLYYSLSEVVVPTYSINSVAEGSGLPQNLQTAWDFSTGANQITNTTTSFISNTGFWKINAVVTVTDLDAVATTLAATVQVTDGVSVKQIWGVSRAINTKEQGGIISNNEFVVFLRSGDSLQGFTNDTGIVLDVTYRQIATVNGTLVNPLGYSAA